MLVDLRKNFTLCLLTNGNSVVQSEKIQRTGASVFFDLVVISGDHPWEKPAPEIYVFIAENLGLKSFADAVMIGDNWDTDMKGGINAEVKALVWIRPPKDEEYSLSDADEVACAACLIPCHRTNDVLEVPSLLAKIYC